MPLLKGKENIGHNVETEENAGKPHAQAVSIALKTAGVPKARDTQPQMATAPSGGIPQSRSFSDQWKGRSS